MSQVQEIISEQDATFFRATIAYYEAAATFHAEDESELSHNVLHAASHALGAWIGAMGEGDFAEGDTSTCVFEGRRYSVVHDCDILPVTIEEIPGNPRN